MFISRVCNDVSHFQTQKTYCNILFFTKAMTCPHLSEDIQIIWQRRLILTLKLVMTFAESVVGRLLYAFLIHTSLQLMQEMFSSSNATNCS